MARTLGMSSIIQRIHEDAEAFQTPLLLTGDMNALPDEICMKMANEFEPVPMQEVTDGVSRTFHGFHNNRTGDYRIDYIYTDKGRKFSKPVLWDDTFEVGENLVYLSDHHAIVSDIEFFED
jgi:endonuclease/exonuclease/phosphatase family metal-dependent hydrolase